MHKSTQRDVLDVDVLFVGAGPASLAGAIRLQQLARKAGREFSVMVIEKGAQVGHHSLSGAIFDERALVELGEDHSWTTPPPFDATVGADSLWYLTHGGRIAAPFVPPPLANGGHALLSLNRFVVWLGKQAEALGVDCFPAFPATEILWDEHRVSGVRIGDKGIGRDGEPLANYEPGPDVRAKITIFGEGVRGTLSKAAFERLHLNVDSEPQVFALGVKELWQLPPGRWDVGRVVHTLGYPLPNETFGGGWLYGMENHVLDIGLVVGLDAPDPSTDAHDAFNRFKLHPKIRPLLEGATLLAYGAKAIPEGGIFALPRLYADGLLLIGDCAGFVNGLRLKGIHLAMKSGMLAAETAFDALVAGQTDANFLARYDERFRASWAYEELHAARNVHQGFEAGLFGGLVNAAFGFVSGGMGVGFQNRLPGKAGYTRLRSLQRGEPAAEKQRVTPDGNITFDKLADVYRSGTRHDEMQPSHLRVADTNICAEQCTREFGNPCQRFCPAQVYHPNFVEHEGRIEGSLRIDFANCVHCKTCDIADPYQIITWVPPQGGDGPVYIGM